MVPLSGPHSELGYLGLDLKSGSSVSEFTPIVPNGSHFHTRMLVGYSS